jgi:hypothetical protein
MFNELTEDLSAKPEEMSTEHKPMFIDDLLIGVIVCGFVMSVVYLRVDLLGSQRQKKASHAVHDLAACRFAQKLPQDAATDGSL